MRSRLLVQRTMSSTAPPSAASYLSARMAPFGAQTVWQEFTPLAAPPPAGLGAVNCGQGFPDWAAPAFVKDALCAAVQVRFFFFVQTK